MDAFARIVSVAAKEPDTPLVINDVVPPAKRRGRKPAASKVTATNATTQEAPIEGGCSKDGVPSVVKDVVNVAVKRGSRKQQQVKKVEVEPDTEHDVDALAEVHQKSSNPHAIKVYSAFVDHVGTERAAPLSISDDENVILQLKISGPDINANGMDLDETDSLAVPNGYNKTVSNTFTSKPFTLSPSTTEGVKNSIESPHSTQHPRTYEELFMTSTTPANMTGACGGVSASIDCDIGPASNCVPDACHAKESPIGGRIVRLLMDFEEKSKIGEWPSNTSVCCHWCCHKFNTVPVGLPVKYVHERFQVVGCFCSMECSAAWNFGSKESSDEIHERYALINLLSSCVGYGKVVRPAPDRCALAMFGGHMNIDEFRRFSTSNKAMMCSSNPMMSLTQQVEEISESELRSEYKFIPLDKDRVNKYQEKIRLRRTKPLINYKNTLDCTMNLRYH